MSGYDTTFLSGSTNVTLTVPPFYPDETIGGISYGYTYPSPLHSIHVESLLSDEEAAMCLELSQAYAAETGRWETPDKKRHETYATCDFAVEDCASLQHYLQLTLRFDERVLSRLHHHFGIDPEDMSYLDFFCANYQETRNGDVSSQKTMDRLEAHRDGSLLSFSVLLTPPSAFEGGGTFFDALRDVDIDDQSADASERVLYPHGVIRPPRAGDCVFHSGKILHGADVVTSGSRTVLVGFVEVADYCQRPGVLGEACQEFGRMDVAEFHYRRQKEKSARGTTKERMLTNSRWLPDTIPNTGQGRSHIRGFIPGLPSFAKRADPEFQRLRKLQAEDMLLRCIMLPQKPNVLRMDELFEGDLTIL